MPAHAKDKPRTPKPAAPAADYPLHDAHDGITIAAEPGDLAETRPNTRLDYFHHGFMPVRVIVTNNTAQPVSLDDVRILFIASDNYTRNAATDEELERRMFSKKSAAGTKIPLPLPIPSITIHHPPVDKQILADDTDFGFPTTTVAPHATVAGYLFYDTRDMDDPVLEKATLELRKVRWASTNKELMSFQIPLKPSEAPSSSAPSRSGSSGKSTEK
ncbi:MAG: hypothetical protein ACRYFU_06310 [Janthinobacterium lividum]